MFEVSPLPGQDRYGAVVTGLDPAAIGDPGVRRALYELWIDKGLVIFRGIQQDIGPISLSSPHEDSGIRLDDLPSFDRQTVERTITARSLEDAEKIVERLRESANGGRR